MYTEFTSPGDPHCYIDLLGVVIATCIIIANASFQFLFPVSVNAQTSTEAIDWKIIQYISATRISFPVNMLEISRYMKVQQ